MAVIDDRGPPIKRAVVNSMFLNGDSPVGADVRADVAVCADVGVDVAVGDMVGAVADFEWSRS